MKVSAVSLSALLGLVVLGSGCVMEVEGVPQEPVAVAESALAGGGCEGILGECRDGNTKMCAKYSERCEVRIGVIGDSLSDEYQGVASQLPGVQWTSQVQADSRITLGAHEANPFVRGEPRNDGYGLNWARFGQAALGIQWPYAFANYDPEDVPPHLAASFAALEGDPRLQTIGSFDAQIRGLGAQIAAGQIDVALVWVGHNDLFIRSYIGYDEDGGQAAFVGALVTRIVTAAAILRGYASADPEDIKAKIAIVGLAGTASALNPFLSDAAAGAGIPFIDPFNTKVGAIATEQATTGAYHVGTASLAPFTLVFVPAFQAIPKVASKADLLATGSGPCNFLGCSTPAYAEPFQHYDAIHPNTIYMGAVGNQILTDLNTTFGFAMQTIPDAQLLATAGL